MIKHVMVALILVMGLSGLGGAEIYELYDSGGNTNLGAHTWWVRMDAPTGTPYTYYGKSTFTQTTTHKNGATWCQCYDQDAGWITVASGSITSTGIDSVTVSGSYSGSGLQSDDYYHHETHIKYQTYASGNNITYSSYQMVVTGTNYTISGNIGCLNTINMYIYNDSTWKLIINDSVADDASYTYDVVDNYQYKIVFNNHEYEFTVNGSDITYNYDECSHTTYRFEESCGNLISDSEGYYCENWIGGGGICYSFHESDGILDISNTSAASIEVYTDTFIGQTRWLIDPVVSNTAYVLQNPTIDWGLKVIVQNESDGTLIDGAMVKVDQDCYCTSGYSTRQKKTVNGMAQFGDMSLQDASLFVMKYGYKILDENTTGYSAFLSGRSNFSSKTWLVKLAPSTSNNSSTFYEVNNKVDIHFRDVNRNRTSEILDTDANVYLYYENNNTENEAMTLKFQSSSMHTYFSDELSWNIPHDEIGHKTIANSYFTPYDYSYRAIIYNSSIYGWNITIPLTVRNATKEDEQHYKNLTTNLWFMYADDGKVDYRDDMKVVIHARSNNTTLMNTDVELWKDGIYIACKNLTETDFANADYPYYYVWNPIFDYVSGSNYSVRMYGFDRTLLETDYVECITDNITRKNKLTIIVKNQNGINVDNAYIYLEEYGSTATGSNYYASFEGLDNGYYRYKASKPDYVGTGWSDITISDDDEIVTYVLSWVGSGSDSTIKQQKMDDTTLRNLYIPLMMLLLILILFGGFKSVI